MDKYIVIYASEDGDVSVSIKSKEGIEGWLDEGIYYPVRANNWSPGAEDGIMIIRGEIVIPVQKTVAWRLP